MGVGKKRARQKQAQMRLGEKGVYLAYLSLIDFIHYLYEPALIFSLNGPPVALDSFGDPNPSF